MVLSFRHPFQDGQCLANTRSKPRSPSQAREEQQARLGRFQGSSVELHSDMYVYTSFIANNTVDL